MTNNNGVPNDATLSLGQSASSLDTGIYCWSWGSVPTSLTGQLCVWKHWSVFGVKGALVTLDSNTEPWRSALPKHLQPYPQIATCFLISFSKVGNYSQATYTVGGLHGLHDRHVPWYELYAAQSSAPLSLLSADPLSSEKILYYLFIQKHCALLLNVFCPAIRSRPLFSDSWAS